MKKRNTLLFFLSLVILVIPYRAVRAQENSILTEVSYLYLEKLIASAKENYPRIKNHISQVAAAKNELSGVKISWLEPFSFQYVTRSNQASSNLVDITTADVLTGYQFGVAINPGSLLSKPSQIKKAKEQVKIAEHERDEYFLNLEAEVKSRYFIFLQSQKAIIPANNVLIDAKTNLDLIKLAYQKAETTLQEFNAASMQYNQAYLNKLQAETTYLSAKASLEELTVKKLEEIK